MGFAFDLEVNVFI